MKIFAFFFFLIGLFVYVYSDCNSDIDDCLEVATDCVNEAGYVIEYECDCLYSYLVCLTDIAGCGSGFDDA